VRRGGRAAARITDEELRDRRGDAAPGRDGRPGARARAAQAPPAGAL